MVVPSVVFDEEFFLDHARFLAELSHSDVKTEITYLGYGTEWQVVYRFGLFYITLRFKVSESHTVPNLESNSSSDYALLLELEHFRVSPRHQGIGRKFTEIFLEELRLTPVKQVILQPKNEEAAGFWEAAGFKAFGDSAIDFKGCFYLDLPDSLQSPTEVK